MGTNIKNTVINSDGDNSGNGSGSATTKSSQTIDSNTSNDGSVALLTHRTQIGLQMRACFQLAYQARPRLSGCAIWTCCLEQRTTSVIEQHMISRFPAMSQGTRSTLQLRLAYEAGELRQIPPYFLDIFKIIAHDMSEADKDDLRVRFELPAARIAYRLLLFLKAHLQPWLSDLHGHAGSTSTPHVTIGQS
ncbi:hypothetical protein RhiJN_16690 [Ceratobasidium sp. AG-Ba]|nr:hypothetical protein RhiJN_16690 [Ceratobasidium sp. AG-Ba]